MRQSRSWLCRIFCLMIEFNLLGALAAIAPAPIPNDYSASVELSGVGNKPVHP